ncbi:hypothetical protein ATCC90586_010567 [Pythium insidiosum]|nr:hypothetical protein ATCC90586_010567 [Pythium insidiosum]
MIVNPSQLPAKATYKPVPWPGSYWPTYQDGINVRWDGNQPSAAEKYARAFNLEPKSFMDALSRNNGILAHSSRRPCTDDNQCYDLNDGSTCAKRDGESRGYCIPTWFGLCHAWAPAAIVEPEPRCAVNKNGVTFQPNDIKALITQVYDGARVPTVFLGARYNGPDSGEGVLDKYGRFADPAARDLGPGFLHIAITNMIGLLNTTFVADVTAGAQVWNQPVRGYEIVSTKPMSTQEGAKQFFNTQTYPFNNQAKSLLYVRNRISYIVESNDNVPLVSTGRVEYFTTKRDYEYVLELDAAGNIIGGEWVGNSKQNHFDFMWFLNGRAADNTVLRSGLSYKNVKDLLSASIQGSC